uniref:Uncharacterized protein n=1 Tax=Cucumis sativus TaxID=3659 RepID=A0A0A0LGQ9_CUCSA
MRRIGEEDEKKTIKREADLLKKNETEERREGYMLKKNDGEEGEEDKEKRSRQRGETVKNGGEEEKKMKR